MYLYYLFVVSSFIFNNLFERQRHRESETQSEILHALLHFAWNLSAGAEPGSSQQLSTKARLPKH